MSLFKKSLIWIEGDVAQLVERRTSNTGPMVRTPSEAILLGDSLKSIGKKSVCFHCIISSQRLFIVSRRKICVQMNCIWMCMNWAGLAIVKHALLWHYRWKYGTLQLVLTHSRTKALLVIVKRLYIKIYFLLTYYVYVKIDISLFPKQIYFYFFYSISIKIRDKHTYFP